MSDADKQALRSNTAAIKCRLIIQADGNLPEIVLTEDNSIKDWEYTDERLVPGKGFIGQFVGRTLDGNLQNISDDFNIIGREAKLMFGVYRMNDDVTTWYDFGNFIITEPEDNEVNDNTKFESMDYAKLFNKPFDGDYTDDEFMDSYNARTTPDSEAYEPVTALWLARYTCKQVGVALATTNFVHNDFQINANPFRAGETCRDVMKAVGKLAFSWVRIGWDNRCYIDFSQMDPEDIDEYDVLDKNQYFDLKTTEVFKPVDGVGIGMKNIDGETAFKFAPGKTSETAENVIYLYDNPLLYTYEQREAAVADADVLFGLTYTQLYIETVGHPWFTGKELIDIIDMEGNHHTTYPFNKVIKYSGHIRSVFDNTDKTEVERTLGYESDIVRSLTDAWVRVNKATGDISAQSRAIQEILEGQDEYYTKEEINTLFINYESGLTNNFIATGGNNKFRNSALWFEEGTGYEYWTGNVKVESDARAISQTAMILQNNDLKQTIIGIPNGKYCISFKCERLKQYATLNVTIDGNTRTVDSEVEEFSQVVDVTTNTIDFVVTCNLADGYKIYDLMCNNGSEKSVWSQYANETRTDTVNISKGITITSTASKATFKANADGIRVENKSEDRVTVFTDTGMETYNAKITGQAEVSGSLFTKVGNQTWINGL